MLSAATAAGAAVNDTVDAIANGSFETPALTAGSFQYGPAGSSWNFSGTAGVATNNSGFTSANPAAPDGKQVAFLQGNGVMTQSVYLDVGAYAILFQAAQRGACQASYQQLYITVDGNRVAYATPSSTNYAWYETASFNVTTAGMHTVLVKGLNPQGGDNTALIDNVSIVNTADKIADASFEAPGVAAKTYRYGPDGSPWRFAGAAVSSNGSTFTSANPNAPDGTQVGVLQGNSSISQSVYLHAGNYAISFQAAQRATHQAGAQQIAVLVDGTRVDTITPSGIQYGSYRTASFPITAAGMHTVVFQGLNPSGGDSTAFLDNVSISTASAVNDGSFEVPGLAAGAFQYAPSGSPWAFAGTAGTASNGSGFTIGNPSAPSGKQVAFLQGIGRMTQSVYLDPGAYAITFQAAQRSASQASYQQLYITVDGNRVAYAIPTSTAYASYQTASFLITAGGMHTILFRGLNPQGGDNTALVDNVTIVTTANVISDGSFESPPLAPGSYRYAPDASPWQFAGASGVAVNGSSFTYANPNAPNGVQVAFLQNTGRMTQSVYLDAGAYAVTFLTAQRATAQASSQQVAILVDGVQVGSVTPSSSKYALYQTPSFPVAAAGMHTVQFVGLNPQGGDNTAFLDAIGIVHAGAISDGDFEVPALAAGTYQVQPAGTLWQYSGAAGVSSNNSSLNPRAPTAPSGTQVGFLQGTGSMSQVVYLDAGTYTLSFLAAQRTSQTNPQQIKVLVDGTQVALITPSSTQYLAYQTPILSLGSPGVHLIQLLGTDPQHASSIALLDNVQIAAA